MGKINQHRKILRDRHHFHPALHLHMFQSMKNDFFWHSQCHTSTRRAQCIVNIKTSWKTYDDLAFHDPFRLKFHGKLTALGDMADVMCPHVSFFRRPKGNDTTGSMFYNIIIVLIIPVNNTGFTASEQLGLAGEVFFKIFMFSWSNVVRRYIGEYTIIKFDPRHAVHLDPLGGNLHNHIFAAFLHHHGKQLLELIRFRRRVLGGDRFSVHESSHCADDPTGLS